MSTDATKSNDAGTSGSCRVDDFTTSKPVLPTYTAPSASIAMVPHCGAPGTSTHGSYVTPASYDRVSCPSHELNARVQLA